MAWRPCWGLPRQGRCALAKLGPIGVVGGGSWGTAVAYLAGQQGREVVHWMRDAESVEAVRRWRKNPRYLPELALPEGIEPTTELEEVARRCKLVLVVVPSSALKEVVGRLGDHLSGDHMLVHGTKGFEAGTLRRMSQILQEESCCLKLGVISGPNLAAEVAAGQPSATVIASRYPAVQAAVAEALSGPNFLVYTSRDVIGAEVGGALKNILAIAAGMASALGFGDNTKALLLTRGLAEIASLGVHLGAEADTFAGLSGLGDLMATCFSPLSRNHQVGMRLAQGEALPEIIASMRQVAEGVRTTKEVHAFAQRAGLAMPITAAVHRVLYDGVPPRQVLEELMALSAPRREGVWHAIEG